MTMAERLPLNDSCDSYSDEEESFASVFSPPSAEQAHGPHGGELALGEVNVPPAVYNGNLVPPPAPAMPPVVRPFRVNIEHNVPAEHVAGVAGMGDIAMPEQETIEDSSRPAALIVGHHVHPLQHPPLLPRHVHNQANVAPHIPQQESQEGRDGPDELVVGQLLRGWLNHHHNIRRGAQRPRQRYCYPIRRQRRPQQADYGSSCLLRVGNVRMLKEKARQGIGVCLTYPPFYIKGYRVCVRVYLDADGIGRGTHLSIVLVLMRGEYDTQLQSPFRQQVTVRLQDLQSDHDTLFLRVTLR
ncbi:uncharacterized protein LOC135343189 [Halichondria panicea]|uniref:uncharacterized protein LOC135343189 n=1 Tax=Halichondria panicea TaxID=6063 RepID=UPI00312BB2F1